MLSFSPYRTASAARSRRTLTLEALEDRNCPAAPSLTYNVTEALGAVTVSGTVTDEAPQFNLVIFSGAITGSAVPAPNGAFSFTAQSPGVGTVHGTAYDNQGLNSGVVDVLFSSQAPSVNFSVTWGPNKQVTVTGHVTDESPTRANVLFSGAISYSIAPNADGNFAFTTTATSVGTIYATATDLFGQPGTANVTLTNAVPEIHDFSVNIAPGRFYTFTGRVTDEWAPGLVVTFGGLPSLIGRTATVASDGTFSLTVELGQNEDGEAQARVTDWWGVQSDLETMLII